MKTDSQRRIREVYLQIQDLPPDLARALVDTLDPDEQAELATLLEADPGFLAQPLPVLLARYNSVDSPTRIGPYELLESIGHGGMGTVYRARRADGLLRQDFAVKLIRAFPGDGSRRQNFQREMQILSLLQHPYIVRFYDGGVTPDGWLYLAMELLDGECFSVAAFPESSQSKLLAAFCMVCEGVAHAHSLNVVHRDLKPQNIMVLADGTPRILDFGVAKLIDESAAGMLTTPGVTYSYASPEQLSGAAAPTAASDVFSLGIILHELLAGKHPFLRASSSATIAAIQSEEPPALPAVAPNLGAVVRRCLERDPARRYGDASELLDDLRRHLAGQRTLAAPPGMWRRLACPLRILPAVAVAVVLVLGGSAYWSSQKQSAELLETLSPRVAGESDVPTDPKARLQHARHRLGLAERYLKIRGATAELLAVKLHYLIIIGETQGHPSVANLGDTRAAAISLSEACAFARSIPLSAGHSGIVWTLRVRACGGAGGALLEIGKRSEAEALFREVVDFTSRPDPENAPSSSAASAAEAHATLARITERQRDWPETLRLLQRAVALIEPYSHQPDQQITMAGHLAALGWAQREAGDLRTALATYQRSEQFLRPEVASRPRDPQPVTLLARNLCEQGRILVLTGQNQSAVAILQRALELHNLALTLEPESVSDHRWRAMTLARLANAAARAHFPSATITRWAHEARQEISRVRRLDQANQLIRREEAEIQHLLQ